MAIAKDPKVGTGKKPKGSDRRLYTDENPKDTVSIKFATVADARATVAKVKKINKPYARKIQILTVGEQRAKVMGKTQVASIFKKAKQTLKAQKEKKDGNAKQLHKVAAEGKFIIVIEETAEEVDMMLLITPINEEENWKPSECKSDGNDRTRNVCQSNK